MPEKTEYAPGTPSWVDLGSPDVGASMAFYGQLFGWEAEVVPDPAAGGYTLFKLQGKNVAGVGPLMGEGQPPAWTTYVSVADADAAIATARGAGATVLVEPLDVFDEGRMAVFADPTGAVLAVWQPRVHKGAQLVEEPGTFGWAELATRDVEAAKAFYGALFGWQGDTHSFGTTQYTEWMLGGQTVGGMMEMNEQWPPEVPPHWMVYFLVDDCDAAAARAQELGGKVQVPPTDIQPGRFAVLTDPQGAAFSIIRLSGESS